MIKKVLAFIFGVAYLTFGFAQVANTNISNGVAFDGEPYIAINPTNSQNLVAAWMGLKLSSGQYRIAIKTRASLDGGMTWTTANSLPHFGSGFGSADVSMAFDKNGLLYICYIDSRQSPDSGGIYVARSIDGGRTWDAPTKAFDAYDVPNKKPIDRPWLVVDGSGGINAGTLYITTKPAPWISPPNRNYYKVSIDSGRTWSPIANIDGGTHLVGNAIAAPMAAPATTANGIFCAAYPSYVPSQNIYPAFYLASSRDGGQTFAYSTIVSAAPAANDTNLKNGYKLITDPSDSEKMVFLTPDAQNGDEDIFSFHSNDGGHTWAGPARVNDDSISNGKDQDMVWGSYNEQGKVAVTWRDRRDAASNGFWNAGYDFYYALSADNGQTFSTNRKLSSQFIAFDSIVAQNGNDFMSCVYHADTLYTVWGDTRSGKMNIYFAKTIASVNTNVGVAHLDGDDQDWNFTPDPVTDHLIVKVDKQLMGRTAIIYDMNGREILSKVIQTESNYINTQDLSPGTYFLNLAGEIKRFTCRR